MIDDKPWTLAGERATRLPLLVGGGATVLLLVICVVLSPVILHGWSDGAFLAVIAAFAASMATLFVEVYSRSWKRGFGRQLTATVSNGRQLLLIPRIRAWMPCLIASDLAGVALGILVRQQATKMMHANWRSQVSATLMPYVSAGLLAILVATLLLRKWGRRQGIGLHPDGIFLWRGFGCRFVSWDWVKDISVSSRPLVIDVLVEEPEDRPREAEESWLMRCRLFRRSELAIATGTFAIDPVGVYAALAYYHRHAESRSELGTDAARKRVALNRFPDINDEIRRTGSAQPASEALS